MTRAAVIAMVVGVVVSVAPALWADGPRAEDDKAKENAELRARVEALEKRNAELGAKVKAMEAEARRQRAEIEDARDRIESLDKARRELKGIEGLQIVPPAPAQPPLLVAPKEGEKKMPPRTVERKFNGMSYYVVPLE